MQNSALTIVVFYEYDMLDYCYTHPFSIKRIQDNFLSEFILETSSRIASQQYNVVYARRRLVFMARFGDGIKSKNIPVHKINEKHIALYASDVKSGKEKSQGRTDTRRFTTICWVLEKLLEVIREKYPFNKPKTLVPIEGDRYSDYLKTIRGLKDSTIVHHKKDIHEFLRFFFPKAPVSIQKIKPVPIRESVENIPVTKANGKRRGVCAALNGYFRFLQVCDGTSTLLYSAAIPLVSSCRRAVSHRIVTSEELDHWLSSIDRNTFLGKRNYAAVLCFSDWGRRVGDVARISLDDINGPKGEIIVANHKKANPFRLPRTVRVGEAIAEYIKEGRPTSESRKLFLTHQFRCKDGTNSVRNSLQRAMRCLWEKSGLPDDLSGTHVLRHRTATHLQRNGCSLKVIADILGHRSIPSAAVYTWYFYLEIGCRDGNIIRYPTGTESASLYNCDF